MSQIKSPEDLLSAIPFMVGYTPDRSVMIIGIKGEEVEFAMRTEFPDEEDLTPQAMMEMVKVIKQQKVEETVLVVYGPLLPDLDDSWKYATMTGEFFQEVLKIAKLKVIDAMVVVNDKFKSLNCDDEGCCPEYGRPVPDIKESQIAVEQIVDGKPMPFASAADMRKFWDERIKDKNVRDAVVATKNVQNNNDRRAAVDTYHKLLDTIETGQDPDQVLAGFLIKACKDSGVRDYLLGATTKDNREAVKKLMMWLYRRAPRRYIAPLAVNIAMLEYEDGNGAAANIILDIAEKDIPSYSMVPLLRNSFRGVMTPDGIEQMRQELHPKLVKALSE